MQCRIGTIPGCWVVVVIHSLPSRCMVRCRLASFVVATHCIAGTVVATSPCIEMLSLVVATDCIAGYRFVVARLALLMPSRVVALDLTHRIAVLYPQHRPCVFPSATHARLDLPHHRLIERLPASIHFLGSDNYSRERSFNVVFFESWQSILKHIFRQ